MTQSKCVVLIYNTIYVLVILYSYLAAFLSKSGICKMTITKKYRPKGTILKGNQLETDKVFRVTVQETSIEKVLSLLECLKPS